MNDRHVAGLIFVVFSVLSLPKLFRKYEWRAPLLELSNELDKNPAAKVFQGGLRRRSTITVLVYLALFIVGAISLLNSHPLEDFKTVALIILVLTGIWLLKGSYEVIRAFNSRNVWLLNYLFSPYIFAWRNDHLSEYSDYEIGQAILRLCNLRPKKSLSVDIDLKTFLIALHRHVRPKQEHDSYHKLLEDNIRQASEMRWQG